MARSGGYVKLTTFFLKMPHVVFQKRLGQGPIQKAKAELAAVGMAAQGEVHLSFNGFLEALGLVGQEDHRSPFRFSFQGLVKVGGHRTPLAETARSLIADARHPKD